MTKYRGSRGQTVTRHHVRYKNNLIKTHTAKVYSSVPHPPKEPTNGCSHGDQTAFRIEANVERNCYVKRFDRKKYDVCAARNQTSSRGFYPIAPFSSA